MIVTPHGLEEIGLRLAPAYPGRSWQELIISNSSDEYIIAALIKYDVIRIDDQMQGVGYLIWHPKINKERDPDKRRALLHIHHMIPPHSTWLVGLNIENTRLENSNLPPLEQVQASGSIQGLSLTPLPIKQVNVTVSAAILEDGRILGSQPDELKKLIDETEALYERRQ